MCRDDKNHDFLLAAGTTPFSIERNIASHVPHVFHTSVQGYSQPASGCSQGSAWQLTALAENISSRHQGHQPQQDLYDLLQNSLNAVLASLSKDAAMAIASSH